MFRFLVLAMFLAVAAAFMAPATPTKLTMSKVSMSGKGFGGGEATRDPEPTEVDPNDPKGKQRTYPRPRTLCLARLARRPLHASS